MFISILLFGSSCVGQKSLRNVMTQKSAKNAVAISNHGDAIIAGLLPIHFSYNGQDNKCDSMDNQGFHLILTLLFAITQVNNNSQLLPGISLGYDIRDTCNSKMYTAQEVEKLLLRLLPFEEGTYGNYHCEATDDDKANAGPRKESKPFIGVISSTTYESTVATANTLSKIEKIIIIYAITS